MRPGDDLQTSTSPWDESTRLCSASRCSPPKCLSSGGPRELPGLPLEARRPQFVAPAVPASHSDSLTAHSQIGAVALVALCSSQTDCSAALPSVASDEGAHGSVGVAGRFCDHPSTASPPIITNLIGAQPHQQLSNTLLWLQLLRRRRGPSPSTRLGETVSPS